jgi:hypothetical protein
LNKANQPVLVLSDGEIAKHSTLILTFADGSPMQTLGFSNNQTAIEVERDDIAGMVQQIGLGLGLSPLPTYDPKAKMITFPVRPHAHQTPSLAANARAPPRGRRLSAASQPRSKRPADCPPIAFNDTPIAPHGRPLTTPRTPTPFLNQRCLRPQR